ncbi:Biotin carboxyl carrier protein of acetyl-CoA carboxylase [Variovorax sp. PBL-H6]|uniref:acetyl-CoA carboxylase biotin carboxyl carrier protein n=1 Tax=Variovorax sp. PBL-H6 TaxID=434009 RepID=UPI001317DC8D|nr:biotin/lipoyl-containing protein [Variovorax sp. PBL-H6]VTU23644.1 Biotin carboxyl carrier protein of acetyl-CoA carboxylase [Variovorax sp. PBL-H6]
MNQEQIRILIEALAGSELSELEYSEDGCTLRLVKQPAEAGSARPCQAARHLRPEADAAQRAVEAVPTDAAGAQSAAEADAAAQCVAPLYGVIHLQPSPGEPLFVQPGQRVAAGQTLCVIEAMKVFNEVRAEADAKLVEVLVRSGDEVEAGQPLFRLA